MTDPVTPETAVSKAVLLSEGKSMTLLPTNLATPLEVGGLPPVSPGAAEPASPQAPAPVAAAPALPTGNDGPTNTDG